METDFEFTMRVMCQAVLRDHDTTFPAVEIGEFREQACPWLRAGRD